MKSHARVVVIGGGVVGVSTLYHLTKKGWTDVVLLERTELTAGSTWHAAGLLPLFNMSYTVGQLHKYSVDLYKKLPAETGQDVSFHVTGNLRLATTSQRMDEYLKYCGTANTIGNASPDKIVEYVAASKHHPALLYWHWIDEQVRVEGHTDSTPLKKTAAKYSDNFGLGSASRNLPGYLVLLSDDGHGLEGAGSSVWGNGFMPAAYQGTRPTGPKFGNL